MWRMVLQLAECDERCCSTRTFFFGQLKEMIHRSDWLQNLMLNAFEACVYNVYICIVPSYTYYIVLRLRYPKVCICYPRSNEAWYLNNAMCKAKIGDASVECAKGSLDSQRCGFFVNLNTYNTTSWMKLTKLVQFLGVEHSIRQLRQLSVVEDATRKWSLEQNWNRLEYI